MQEKFYHDEGDFTHQVRVKTLQQFKASASNLSSVINSTKTLNSYRASKAQMDDSRSCIVL